MPEYKTFRIGGLRQIDTTQVFTLNTPEASYVIPRITCVPNYVNRTLVLVDCCTQDIICGIKEMPDKYSRDQNDLRFTLIAGMPDRRKPFYAAIPIGGGINGKHNFKQVVDLFDRVAQNFVTETITTILSLRQTISASGMNPLEIGDYAEQNRTLMLARVATPKPVDEQINIPIQQIRSSRNLGGY